MGLRPTMGLCSVETRWMIIGAWLLVQQASEVAAKLGVTANIVRHWVGVYNSTGTDEAKGGQGRKRVLGPGGARKALAMLKNPAMSGSKAVACKLKDLGVTKHEVHRTTVTAATRTATGKKLVADMVQPMVELTAATKAKWLALAQKHRGTYWAKVMFTDRKKFLLCAQGPA